MITEASIYKINKSVSCFALRQASVNLRIDKFVWKTELTQKTVLCLLYNKVQLAD